MKIFINSIGVSAGIALVIYPMIVLAYMITKLFQEKYGELLFGIISLVETKEGVSMTFSNNFFFSMLGVLVISFIIIFPLIRFVEKRNATKK